MASQIDLAPTLLPFIGLDLGHPMFGRDLLSLDRSIPGRALCQFHDNAAFLVGERVVVNRPGLAPTFFLFRQGRLVPTRRDPELARDALAHLLVPGLVYYERLHRLP